MFLLDLKRFGLFINQIVCLYLKRQIRLNSDRVKKKTCRNSLDPGPRRGMISRNYQIINYEFIKYKIL